MRSKARSKGRLKRLCANLGLYLATLVCDAGGTRLRACVDFSRGAVPTYAIPCCGPDQVRQGGLAFQRELSAILRDFSDVKVYSCSPFDLEERRHMKDRFGGDVVYFFNDAALRESMRLGIELQFVAEISDNELPRRRALVVGIPEQNARA